MANELLKNGKRAIRLPDEIRKQLISTVMDAERRVTPLALEQSVLESRRRQGVSRKDIRRALKLLVESGELAYAYQFGTSYVEKSFSSPVRLGKFIKLIPPGMTVSREPGVIPVRIMPGASFGAGNHPTTRLCISGIEFCFERWPELFHTPGSCVLDIGTGSGILAVVSLLLGVESAVGTDLDPCSKPESQTNADLNGVLERFEFSDDDICRMSRRFDLVAANLRTPTLIDLGPEIRKILKPGGALVLSGVRDDETSNVIRRYSNLGLAEERRETEKKWAGLVLSNQSIETA